MADKPRRLRLTFCYVPRRARTSTLQRQKAACRILLVLLILAEVFTVCCLQPELFLSSWDLPGAHLPGARPAMDKARAACCGLALSCSRSACSRRSCPWPAAWLAFGQRTRPGRPQLARKNRCKAQVIPVMYRWELIPGVGGLDELGPHASSLVVLGTHEVASEAWWARAKTIRYDHYTEDSCSPRC